MVIAMPNTVKLVDPSEFVVEVRVQHKVAQSELVQLYPETKRSLGFKFNAKLETVSSNDRVREFFAVNVEIIRLVSWFDSIKNVGESDSLLINGKLYRVLGTPVRFGRPNQLFGFINAVEDVTNVGG